MDTSDPVIIRVKALEIPMLEIETQDGYRYVCNLAKFESVYCFPKSQSEWQRVSPFDGDSLIWENRFEIHVDQAVAHAVKKEKVPKVEAS